MTLLLGNLLGIPGVGRLVFTQAEMLAAITEAMPEAATQANLADTPPIALIYSIWPLIGIVAGFTINGLFAFGEEYGWRGVLMDELQAAGRHARQPAHRRDVGLLARAGHRCSASTTVPSGAGAS